MRDKKEMGLLRGKASQGLICSSQHIGTEPASQSQQGWSLMRGPLDTNGSSEQYLQKHQLIPLFQIIAFPKFFYFNIKRGGRLGLARNKLESKGYSK